MCRFLKGGLLLSHGQKMSLPFSSGMPRSWMHHKTESSWKKDQGQHHRSSWKISQLLRKALVTSPSLFFFLLSYVIIFTVFTLWIRSCAYILPALMSRCHIKKQTDSKLQRGSSYMVVIDACAAFFLSAQERLTAAVAKERDISLLCREFHMRIIDQAANKHGSHELPELETINTRQS